MLCEFFDPALGFQENYLSKAYVELGHEVVIVTSTLSSVFDYYYADKSKQVARTEQVADHTNVVRLPYAYNFRNRIKKLAGLSQVLAETTPDVIFLHDISPNFTEVSHYKTAHPDCSLIYDCHVDYSNSGQNWLSLNVLHRLWRRYHMRALLQRLDRVFTVVPHGASFMTDIYAIPAETIELLPLGGDLDLGQAARNSTDRNALRASLGVAAQDFLIFTGGKLEPRKRTDELLRALIQLKDARIHLVIAGSVSDIHSDYGDKLKTLADQAGNTTFLGWTSQEDIHRYLYASDIAIFPASQSVLWQTSICMGLPVVVGDEGRQDPSYLNRADNMIVLAAEQIEPGHLANAIQSIQGTMTNADQWPQAPLKSVRHSLTGER